MKLKNKILIYFSSTLILLSIIALTVIFLLFSEFRQDEFQQRQKQKIKLTVDLLAEYKTMSKNLTELMDNLTIHDFYDEKMLIFDSQKELTYSSVDDLPIVDYKTILNTLSPSNRWVESKEGDYEVVGVYIEGKNAHFYAISKAYDNFGYAHLYFLRNVLIVIFFVISTIIILVSIYFSNIIAKPIKSLAEHLNRIDLNKEDNKNVITDSSTFELQYLTQRFNELLDRTKEAFAFQKHAAHHISHELKTPIAVLVSEMEKIVSQTSEPTLRNQLNGQILKTKSLGEVIHILLELSKVESGYDMTTQEFRVDELLFDIISELNMLFSDFKFEVSYLSDKMEEDKLIIKANKLLIKQAFLNLLSNCIAYSSNSTAKIEIDTSLKNRLIINVSNPGDTLSDDEQKFLFNHFYRGSNSHGKAGFGLGLVFAKRIFELHKGKIRYSAPATDINLFEIILHS